MIFPNGRLSFVNDGWTWKWSKEKVEWGIKNKFIEIVPTNKKKNGWTVKYKNTDYTATELSKSSYSRRKDHQFDRSDVSLSNLFNDINIPFKGCPYQE